MEDADGQLVACPHCGESKTFCEHVVLDYDLSFNEGTAGYLLEKAHNCQSDLDTLIEAIISEEYPDIFEYFNYVEEGGAGFTSSCLIIYAQNAQNAIKELDSRLSNTNSNE